jgi:hypothetical protein
MAAMDRRAAERGGKPASSSSNLSNVMLNGLQVRRLPPAGAASQQQQPDQTPRERLIAFYQVHNRTKLSSVDSVLLKYRGKEERLFELLEKKYGVSTRAHQLPRGVPAKGNGTQHLASWCSLRLLHFSMLFRFNHPSLCSFRFYLIGEMLNTCR